MVAACPEAIVATRVAAGEDDSRDPLATADSDRTEGDGSIATPRLRSCPAYEWVSRDSLASGIDGSVGIRPP